MLWEPEAKDKKDLTAHVPGRHSLSVALAAALGIGSSCCRCMQIGPRVLTHSQVSLLGLQGRLTCWGHHLLGNPFWYCEGTLSPLHHFLNHLLHLGPGEVERNIVPGAGRAASMSGGVWVEPRRMDSGFWEERLLRQRYGHR